MIDDIVKKQREYFKSGKTRDVKMRFMHLNNIKAAIVSHENDICSAL